MTDQPFHLDKRIPTHMRACVAAGREPPLYVINAPDYDRLPLDTFLIETEMGTEGRVPALAIRVVKPNDWTRYQRVFLTPDKRLLFAFWARRLGDGATFAVRQLIEPKRKGYRHVVLPDDPRHEMLAAFKMACDARRAMSTDFVDMKPDLLVRALGVLPWPAHLGANGQHDPAHRLP